MNKWVTFTDPSDDAPILINLEAVSIHTILGIPEKGASGIRAASINGKHQYTIAVRESPEEIIKIISQFNVH